MSKRVNVILGSRYTTIYNDKILLLKEPSCLIIKKGKKPKIVAVGYDAQERKNNLSADEELVFPIINGEITHFIGAAMLIQEFFRQVKIEKNCEIYTYYSCGISQQQKNDIENIFFSIGFSKIFLLEDLLILNPLLRKYENVVSVFIDSSHTDVGIIDKNGIVLAYYLDIGTNECNKKIIEKVKELHKIKISYGSAEKLRNEVGSLYKDVLTRSTATGKNMLTNQQTFVDIISSDIYEDIYYCYKRIIKVIEGMLAVAPSEKKQNLSTDGIFIFNEENSIDGLENFFFENLHTETNEINELFLLNL